MRHSSCMEDGAKDDAFAMARRRKKARAWTKLRYRAVYAKTEAHS